MPELVPDGASVLAGCCGYCGVGQATVARHTPCMHERHAARQQQLALIGTDIHRDESDTDQKTAKCDSM